VGYRYAETLASVKTTQAIFIRNGTTVILSLQEKENILTLAPETTKRTS
jgi:hypothetical protein